VVLLHLLDSFVLGFHSCILVLRDGLHHLLLIFSNHLGDGFSQLIDVLLGIVGCLVCIDILGRILLEALKVLGVGVKAVLNIGDSLIHFILSRDDWGHINNGF
jgi:hypothetical protein